MSRILTTSVMTLLLVCTAASLLADDLYPPRWRGDPLTVVAEWEFPFDFTPDPMNIPPDNLVWVGDGVHPYNEFPDCWTHAHASSDPQGFLVLWEQDPTDPNDGRAYTDATHWGRIDFFVCNFIDDYEFKYIRVQITYGGAGMPYVLEFFGPPWDNPFYGILKGAGNPTPNMRVEDWWMVPNPAAEHIVIEMPPGTWIDQVVIDTISTNEEIEVQEKTWGGVKALYK